MGGFERLSRPELWGTETKIQHALETMKARGVKDDYCPRCSAIDWSVDLVDIPANSAMSMRFTFLTGTFVQRPVWEQPTGALSFLSIVCKNCGYTLFHTLSVLERPKER